MKIISERLRNILYILGMGILIANTAVLCLTFVVAYASPAKVVVVSIDTFGEADLELIVWVLTLPLAIITTYGLTKNCLGKIKVDT